MESVKPSSIKWKAQKEKRDLAFFSLSEVILFSIRLTWGSHLGPAQLQDGRKL
jgi:hypothetical protein